MKNPNLRGIEIEMAENGVAVHYSTASDGRKVHVFRQDEQRELLEHLCRLLEIGSDVIDWSSDEVPEPEKTGGTPSGQKFSEDDI